METALTLSSASKPTLGTKIDHAKEQGKNTAKTYLKTRLAYAGGAGLTAGAAYGVYKSPALQGAIQKGIDFLKGKGIGEGFSLIGSAFKALPTPVKAVIVAGAGLTAVIMNKVAIKGIKNSGKIQQQYEDKAKMQNLVG